MDMEKVIKGLEICADCGFCESIKKYDLRCPYRDNNGKGCDRSQLLMDALALLKEQETQKFFVDESGKITPLPVIVRCKDCKHGGCRTQNTDGSIFRVVCKKHSTKRNERWMDADWFCADGERKDS